MAFDEASIDHLSSILIDLYSDKELAVIREYSTNAYDSHKEIGQTRPIEITTPNYLSYFFKVKDWGTGLSVDDIREIYSKYGASTRRNSNLGTGMLGLGCKSALTYTNQFTIVSVKDGYKINVAVSRSESGGGVMTILSETQTTEPNGVEIIIPVHKNNSFNHKTHQFFQFWEKGTVLIDGKAPQKPGLSKITDRIYLKENPNWNDNSYIVMGGVTYEVDQKQINLPQGLVAFVDIGDVHFTPSREQLHYTPHTLKALEKLRDEYKANVMKTIQAEIDQSADYAAAVKRFTAWTNTMQRYNMALVDSDFTYKGTAMKVYYDFDAVYIYEQAYGDKHKNHWEAKGVTWGRLQNYFIVTDFTDDKVTPYQRRKLNYYAEQQGESSRFVFCDKLDSSGWLDDFKQVKWQDIKDIKLTRAGANAAGKPTYDFVLNHKRYTATELDKNKPIFYSTKRLWEKFTAHLPRNHKLFPDVQFVFVGQNREAKFLRTYKHAVKLETGLRKHIDEYWDSLTDDDKSLIKSDYWERERFAKLDPTKLLDVDLVAVVNLHSREKEINDKQRQWDSMCSIARSLDDWQYTSRLSNNGSYKWVFDRYPLLDQILRYVNSAKYKEHIYLYLNTVYEQLSKVSI